MTDHEWRNAVQALRDMFDDSRREEAFRMAVEKIASAVILLESDQHEEAIEESREPVGKPDIREGQPPAPDALVERVADSIEALRIEWRKKGYPDTERGEAVAIARRILSVIEEAKYG